jgi:hypothetical protein
MHLPMCRECLLPMALFVKIVARIEEIRLDKKKEIAK